MSSSAQLTLWPWLLGWEQPDDRTTFAAGLHAGSCLGLAVALRQDLTALDRRTAGRLALTGLPAAAVGLVAHDVVGRRLGRPGPTAALLAGAGVAMWLADRRPQERAVGPREARVAALAQVAALAPGVSRSGATLTALRAQQVRRAEAARFSMLMSLPITAGAAGLTMVRARRLPPLTPTVLAGVSAWGAAVTLDPGSRRLLSGAALYRVALATAVVTRLRKGSG